MPKLSRQEMEAFLARPLICRLGCLDDEGYPYVVPCIYLYTDGVFYVTPRARSIWGEYLHRDGRCFLCIDASDYEEEEYNKRVFVQGTAELIDGPRSWYPSLHDDPMAQRAFRVWRRYWGEDTVDGDVWKGLEELRDVGFRHFRVHPLKITTWWGDYASRYRNVYPVP